MRKIFTTLAILGVCISALNAQTNQTKENFKNKMLSQGPAKICSSNVYTKCFNTSKGECLQKIRPLIEQCYKQQEELISVGSSNKHLKMLGTKIGKCAGELYSKKYASKQDGKCIDKEAR